MRYRNVSGHPEDLDGGRVVGTGEVFDLSSDELKSEFNQRKIEEGAFKALKNQPAEEQESKLSAKDRKALLARATELNVENGDALGDSELASAVAEAEKQKEAQV